MFTAPWEPVVVRRGDALGLRALADQFADAVSPDLSNRVTVASSILRDEPVALDGDAGIGSPWLWVGKDQRGDL